MAGSPAKKRDFNALLVFGPAALLTLLGFFAAYQFVEPAPPDRLVIATGRSDGAYYEYARRYREILTRFDVDLVIRETAGSVENIRLLDQADGEVALAFVQSGTLEPGQGAGLMSLASLYYEPLWVFHRPGLEIRQINDLRGRPVAVGARGSGTRRVAEQILQANAIGPEHWRDLAGTEAADALLAGTLDALLIVGSPTSPVVSRLLRDPGAVLFGVPRTAAYTRRFPFLAPLLLPEGGYDLIANLPARDLQLLAPVATLVARNDLHPALVDLLLQAATEVHKPGGVFERPGEFPSSQYLELPLSEQASRFLERGPPFLQRYLPFWAANLIDRLKVMLVPLIALLIPLLRVMPPLYRWRTRARIHRWYRRLRELDDRASGLGAREAREQIDPLLRQLDQEIAELPVPTPVIEDFYHLRSHIQFLRRELQAAAHDPPSADAQSPHAAPEGTAVHAK